jgi:hypothetical protein
LSDFVLLVQARVAAERSALGSIAFKAELSL